MTQYDRVYTVNLALDTNLNAEYIKGYKLKGEKKSLVIDGQTVVKGSHVLLMGQDEPVQNGVYVVTNTGSNIFEWCLKRESHGVRYVKNQLFWVLDGRYKGKFFVTKLGCEGGDHIVVGHSVIEFLMI